MEIGVTSKISYSVDLGWGWEFSSEKFLDDVTAAVSGTPLRNIAFIVQSQETSVSGAFTKHMGFWASRAVLEAHGAWLFTLTIDFSS